MSLVLVVVVPLGVVVVDVLVSLLVLGGVLPVAGATMVVVSMPVIMPLVGDVDMCCDIGRWRIYAGIGVTGGVRCECWRRCS